MNRILIALIISVFVVSAHAQKKRSRTVSDLLNNIEKQSRIKKNKRSLPKYKKFRAKQSQVNLRQIKPPSSNQFFYEKGTSEAELEKTIDEGIAQLYSLTKRFKNSSKRGELWLRLAELYVEKARFIEFQLENEYDKKLAQFREKKIKRKPRLNLKPAQAYNKKAIQLYEWFIRDFPKDDKVDQALFFLGFNYFELGDVKKGQAYYKRLAKEYPKSTYVYETNFALGEFYFENENWKESLNYYAKVASNKRHRLYSFALYKKAWSEYKLGRYKSALKNIERVIYEGRRSKSANANRPKGVNSIRLANEALKDLVIFFVEAKDYRGAKSYFQSVAGRKSGAILYERLAFYYMDRGMRKAARYIFNELIESDPMAPKAFDYQYKIVTMYSAAGNESTFRKELFQWIEDFGPSSPWQKANQYNQKLVKKSIDLAEATLRNYTLQLHQTAQNSRAKNSQDSAQKGYELYFATFPQVEKSAEMHFFYAELLYDMKKYADAAIHYRWIVDNAKSSKYFKEALLNAILSLEKKLPTPDQIKKIVGDSREPIEFDQNIQDFEKSAQEYFVKVPQGKNKVEIKYKLASLYYSYNQFDNALKYFNEIIAEYPKSKFAEYSANLILDIYNLRQDYAGLQQAADNILAVPGLKNSKIGSQVNEIKQRSSFKSAETFEKAGDHAKAAKAYEDFANNNPKSPLVTSARFNAGVNFEKVGNFLPAIAMYSAVLSSGDKEHAKLKKDSRKFLAQLYERTGQYPKAAAAFESYANDFPDDPDTTDFYLNAAVIRDGMRYFTAALKNYQKFYDRTKSKERLEVLFNMGRIWEKRGKFRRAIGYYEQYMNSNTENQLGVIETAFRVGKLYDKIGNRKLADEWYTKTVVIQRNIAKKGSKIGVRYAAEAKFELVSRTYDELRAVRIPANPAKQGAAVQKKLNLLNKLKEDLKTVISYDDADQIVAALTLQGQALQHLSAAIFNAPIPKGLKPDELQVYKQEIDKLARPLQQQAIDSYKAAIERGFSLSGYNDWLLIATKELHRYDESLYRDKGETTFIVKMPDEVKL